MKTRYRVLIWILLSIFLYLLFLGSRMNDIEAGDKIIKLILEISEADTMLNESVLKNRYGLEKNYDRIEKASIFINNSLYILDNYNHMFNIHSYKENSTLIKSKEGFSTKIHKIEIFKEKNSMYNNSISLFPHLIKRNIKNNSAPKDSLELLQKNILFFNTNGDEDSIKISREMILKLSNINSTKRDTELEFLLYHSNIILDFKKELDSTVNEIIDNKFTDHIDNLGIEFSEQYKVILKRANIFSVLLYSLSVGVLLYSAFLLLKLIISSFFLRKANENLLSLNQSFEKFVPKESLQLLSVDTISTIQLGKSVKREMTVLFSDIRSFTSISEKMSPEENFEFINSYLKEMGPIVRNHNGFIDKFIGDAIMALFKGDAEDAIRAGIQMFKDIKEYNTKNRNTKNRPPLEIGIGVHTGEMMFGTVGENDRMETTVISDSVNLASRIESITKFYGVGFLISEHIYESLDDPNKYKIRFIDKVRVKGKTRPIKIYEVYDADNPEFISLKDQTKIDLENAVLKFYARDPKYALELLKRCKSAFPDDPVIRYHHDRCKKMIPKLIEPEEEWLDATEPHF